MGSILFRRRSWRVYERLGTSRPLENPLRTFEEERSRAIWVAFPCLPDAISASILSTDESPPSLRDLGGAHLARGAPRGQPPTPREDAWSSSASETSGRRRRGADDSHPPRTLPGWCPARIPDAVVEVAGQVVVLIGREVCGSQALSLPRKDLLAKISERFPVGKTPEGGKRKTKTTHHGALSLATTDRDDEARPRREQASPPREGGPGPQEQTRAADPNRDDRRGERGFARARARK